ncbi:methyltransferase-like protein 27 isoform X2 [Hemiscyllium ocellatum]|nr:methyltransferase-like protein 27 isoform X2 [Hemiscyllium ocellatum]XP_060704168.1 methyltransferase-like protein 27 isoform X2 [Hemiscyllium ocellatum]XP_060704169.1 methyltransferase-like protein 27 isoform X2 [Hemiscyllium ocellatum]XP_060704170.1 methyltransferase-like protein 27 isoform X2 [Hemiscyllium ocellatum]XP_060704171.1 methyltransferase-like protein 27 isoform X2 [Hemiscyllium ocellatum]XP_060704172.1 methyltransferase-like protein 27 isoform X2 [Hemiscyllium ocellatum]
MAANQRTFTDVQRTVLSAHKESTTEDKMSFYDSWSELYEQDMIILDYRAPVMVAESLAAVIHEDRDKALVLDVACGTGLVAKQLQRFGFRNFHGMDGSQEMLELARSKSIYQTLQKCVLDSELLPASSDSYDVVVIVGALSGGQVPFAILPELHRVTKPGGFVCMTTRSNTSNQLYKKQLQAVIEQMEQNGLWERITVQEIEHWEKAIAECEAEQGSTYISGTIYLYRKSRN